MKATATRANGHGRSHAVYNLSKDYKKIKSALSSAHRDVKKQARKLVDSSYTNLKDRSSEAQDLMTYYVTEKPLKTIAMAACVGFVLGFLFRK